MAQSQARRNAWEGLNGRSQADIATNELHVYIYDYCKKHNFQQAAKAFASEANVSTDQMPPVDIPSGFLGDWWGVFWDVYNAKHNEVLASKEAQVYDNYTAMLHSRREEIIQQHRAQQQAVAAQQQQQQQQQQRRASEALRNSPQQQHMLQQPQQQQYPGAGAAGQTPQSVPSQQQPQQHARPSPASSTTSLPTSGMPTHPTPNTNTNPTTNLVHTPQSMPASLPQQHMPGRPPPPPTPVQQHQHASSPSFSPQIMQQQQQQPRMSEPMGAPTPGQPQQQHDMMNSPMVGPQGMPMSQAMLNSQRAAAVAAAGGMQNPMMGINLNGRDFASMTPEERNAIQMQIKRQQMAAAAAAQGNMMRNPNMMNHPGRPGMPMQQQPQQQHPQGGMTPQQQQQMMQAQQQAAAAAAAAAASQQPPHMAQQQPQQQQQQQQQPPATPQQAQSMPPNQQQHAMDMAAARNAAMVQAGNGQPRVTANPSMTMGGPAAAAQMTAAMQNPNAMGNSPFATDPATMNMMMQQMISKGQLPPNMTAQQQMAFRQQQHQRMLAANRARMMQQQQYQQQQQMAAAAAASGAGQGPNPMVTTTPGGMPMTAAQAAAAAAAASGAGGAGSPQDPERAKAIAQYQRQMQFAAAQAAAAAKQQQQSPQTHPNKRPRLNTENEPGTPVNQPGAHPSPQLSNVGSPMMNQQGGKGGAGGGRNMPPQQQGTPMQQRASFTGNQEANNNNGGNQSATTSPQTNRNNKRSTPTQAPQQIPSQQQQQPSSQQQRMQWNTTGMEMGSPASTNVKPETIQSPATVPSASAAVPSSSAAAGANNMSFDLERFMMSDGGDFAEIFAANDDGDAALLMGDGGDMDGFSNSFLASMGGNLGVDGSLSLPVAGQVLQQHGELQGHTNKVMTCAFSPNGQYLVSGGRDKHILVWGVHEKTKLYDLGGHGGVISCVRWSPDDRNLVATASYDKSIRIWDIGSALSGNAATAKQILMYERRISVVAIDFCPGRPEIICSMDQEGELDIWNMNTQQTEKRFKMPLQTVGPNPLRCHPRDSNIVACAVGNQLYVVNVTNAKNNGTGNDAAIRTITTEDSKNISALDWSPDGNFLVTCSEGHVAVYDASHWKMLVSQSVPGKISSCAFANSDGDCSPDKLRVVFGEYEAVYIWQCGVSGAQPKQAGTQPGTVACIACASMDNTQVVATASHSIKDKNLILWTL